MSILSPEQLTGRVTTHVRELPELRCTLHPSAATAFLALRETARRDGIDLVPVSSFRDFNQQLGIWNAKFRGQRPLLDRGSQLLDVAVMQPEEIVSAILLWSALPGASRHHWGSEIDVIDRAALAPGQTAQLVPSDYGANGPFAALGTWLPEHSGACDFFLPYDCDRGGVAPEPWHLSYAPVSAPALEALTPDVLADALIDAPLEGADVVRRQLPDIHRRYVRGVAPALPRRLAGS